MMPKAKKPAPTTEKDRKHLKKVLEEPGFADFIQYMRSPWRIFWLNFIAGIFRGVGILLGMTVVVGILVWIAVAFLSRVVDFPLVGQYFEMILNLIQQYAPAPGVPQVNGLGVY